MRFFLIFVILYSSISSANDKDLVLRTSKLVSIYGVLPKHLQAEKKLYQYKQNELAISIQSEKKNIKSLSVYKDTRLSKEYFDFNQDGIIDEHIIYPGSTSLFKIVYKENNKKNFHTKIEFYKKSVNEGDQITIKTYSLDSKRAKFKEVSSRKVLANAHLDERCLYSFEIDEKYKADNLSRAFLDVEFNRNRGFIYLSPSIKIHKSCVWRRNAFQLFSRVQDAVNDGLQCLNNLHKFSRYKSDGLEKIILRLNEIYNNESNPQKIICNESRDHWRRDSNARGSYFPGELSSTDVMHPFITINPKFKKKNLYSDDPNITKYLILHEAIHNTGFLHGDEHEYAYTCANCCFPRNGMSESEEELSCKICQNEYLSPHSEQYYLDVIALNNHTPHNMRVYELFVNSPQITKSAKLLQNFPRLFKKHSTYLFAAMVQYASRVGNINKKSSSYEFSQKEIKQIPSDQLEFYQKMAKFFYEAFTNENDLKSEDYFSKEKIKELKDTVFQEGKLSTREQINFSNTIQMAKKASMALRQRVSSELYRNYSRL